MTHPQTNNPHFFWTPLTSEMVRPLTRTEIVVLIALGERGAMWGNATPSLETISKMTGVERRNIQKSLRSLEDKGFIETLKRYSDDGRQTYNLYRAKKFVPGFGYSQPDEPETGANPPEVASDATLEPPVKSDGGRVVISATLGGGEIYRPYRDTRDRKENPSLSPFVDDGSGQGTEPGNAPAKPATGRQRKSRKRTENPTMRTITASDLPAGWEQHAEGIVRFWNEAKGGTKTVRAFNGLMHSLERIREEGGDEEVSGQLAKAIEDAEHDRPWQSIKYQRWKEFHRPIGNKAARGAYKPQEGLLPSQEVLDCMELAQKHPELYERVLRHGNGQDGFSAQIFYAQRVIAAYPSYPAFVCVNRLTDLKHEIEYLNEKLPPSPLTPF